MASLRKHKKSRFWYACVRMADGSHRQFSTGLEDKTEALAVAVAAEREFRKNTESPHQLRAALDRLAGEYSPRSATAPAAWLERWLEQKKNEVGAGTWASYRNTGSQLIAFLKERGCGSFLAVTPAMLGELRERWAAANCAATANLKIRQTSTLFAAAVAAGVATSNPAAKVGKLKAAATVRREFRPAELDLLLPTLRGEWRALVLLGLYTGQRLNDLAGLRWRNVDLAEATVAFQASKTGAVVALPIMPPALEALLELPAGDCPDAPLFPGVAAMPVGSRSNAFRKLLCGVGLATDSHTPTGRAKGRRVTAPLSFHSLRHTATSMLKAAGVSDAIARAIIGHESAAVSRSYTHFDMATMRREMARMPGAGGAGIIFPTPGK